MDERLNYRPGPGLPLGKSASGPQELFERAERVFAVGRLAEAVPLYRQLLADRFLPGVQLYRLGMIANRNKDWDDAWQLHRQSLEANPLLASHITPPSVSHHRIVCRPRYDTEDVPYCPVCGSAEQAPLMVVNCLPFNSYHPAFDPIRRWVGCRTCGHGFANPRPTAAALTEAFRDPPPAHLLDWSYEGLMLVSDVVHRLWRRHPGGDLLDVGVGGGALAGLALDYGYRVCGLDLHPGYAERVRRLGVEFVAGDIGTHDFGNRQFDVIVMGDVIEHVTEPRQAWLAWRLCSCQRACCGCPLPIARGYGRGGWGIRIPCGWRGRTCSILVSAACGACWSSMVWRSWITGCPSASKVAWKSSSTQLSMG